MRRHDLPAIAALLAIAAVVPAHAQTRASALPAPPSDLRAIEARLSTILDNAPDREVIRFQLPSGAAVLVRAYIAVDRDSGRPCRVCRTPCRGYRIDYVAPPEGSLTAVEGFRCRAPGGSWTIIQPETVIAQGGPQGWRAQGAAPRVAEEAPGEPQFAEESPGEAPFGEESRFRAEPFIGGEGFGDRPPTPIEEVPLPRPAPPRPQRAATDDAAGGDGAERGRRSAAEAARAALARAGRGEAPGTPAADREEDAAGREPATAAGDAPREETASARAAPEAAADGGPDRTAAANGIDDAAEPAPLPPPARPTPEEVARAGEPVPTEPGTRVIYPGPGEQASPTEAGDRADAEAPIDDPEIIAALRDLHYLDRDAEPTGAEVAAAVDEFAVDEGFALPVAPEELAERLAAARERSDALAVCASEGEDSPICLEAR